MYCSNCGSQIKPELNFCSRCGAKVAKGDSDAQKSVAENLSTALGYIGGFGLVGYIFVALVLVKNSVPVNAIIAVSLFYLGAIFGICYLILQQIDKFSGKSFAPVQNLYNNFQTEQLNPANTAQLESPRREPAAASVTENTTKTLDEVLLKRN
jgi:uncharacterized membrane protein YvbJ